MFFLGLDPRLFAILAFDSQRKRLYGVSKSGRQYMESTDIYGLNWHVIHPTTWAKIRQTPGIKFVQEVPFIPETRFTRKPAPKINDTDNEGNIWGGKLRILQSLSWPLKSEIRLKVEKGISMTDI